jgi:hypothetical protein
MEGKEGFVFKYQVKRPRKNRCFNFLTRPYH